MDSIGKNMSTLTVEFKGVPEAVLQALVRDGYAKTKAEALRYALLRTGETMGLVPNRLHARAEEYVYQDYKRRHG
jgi:hypothetical protein